MFQAIRRQLNPATVMAFIALVFATTGGAVAITGHNGGGNGGNGANATAAKSKAKPKGKPGPRGPAGPKGETGPAGPAGPAGPTGPAGSAGAKGENGAAGASGTNGTDGESVLSAALGEGEDGCAAGGSKFTVGGKTTTACNGEPGEPGQRGPAGTTGFTTTLPEGETETGTWSAFFPSMPSTSLNEGKILASSAISFPIPLKEAIGTGAAAAFVPNCEYLTEATAKQACESAAKNAEKFCPGTSEEPKADEGDLCIYQGTTNVPEEAEFSYLDLLQPGSKAGPGGGTGTTGATLFTKYEGPESSGPVYTLGTWAVTAPKKP